MQESQRTQKQTKSKRKWAKRIVVVLLVYAVYRFVFWFPIRNVNDSKLKEDISNWAGPILCTDIKITDLAVDISPFGNLYMNCEDIDIEHPDQSFSGKAFRAQELNLSCPVWGLWGFRVKPQGVVKRPELTVEWSEQGYNSLAGIFDPIEEVKDVASPFGRVNARTLTFSLVDGKIHLKRPRHRIDLGFNGKVMYDTRKRKLWGELMSSSITAFITGEQSLLRGASVDVSRFEFRVREGDGAPVLTKLDSKFERLPLRALRTIIPHMPVFDGDVMVSGRTELNTSVITAYGDVDGFALDMVGMDDSVRIESIFDLDQSREDSRKVNLLIEDSGKIARLDMSFSGNATENYLELRCDEFALGSLPPLLSFVPKALTEKLSCFSQIKVDTAKLLVKGVPVEFRCPGSSGSASFTINQKVDGSFVLKGRVLKAVLPVAEAGELVRGLASIPQAVDEVERMRRKALGMESNKDIWQTKTLAMVDILYMNIEYTVEESGKVRILFSGKSRQLGRISGVGIFDRKDKGGYLGTMQIAIKEAPVGLFMLNRNITKNVRAAIEKQVTSKEGLRIDIDVRQGKVTIQRQYIEDIFMKWNELQAKSH